LRLSHFEQLRPVCPVCLHRAGQEHLLRVAVASRQQGSTIQEGMLHCGNPQCLREYPIIDGIPLLVPDIRAFVGNGIMQLLARDDLSEALEGVLGDCCGPGSSFDSDRMHLSSYAWDHYGDLDPAEPAGGPRPGSVLRVLERSLTLGDGWQGPVLDLGCSVGRTSFVMAEEQEGLVVGVDLNFSMLRLAARILREGRVRYPRRRIGLVYDRREFDGNFLGSDRVDFWACDALALPFAPATFGSAVALNVLDCVSSPRDLLAGVQRVLRPGALAAFTTPYDWSPAATPVEAWMGGHSQRGENQGAAEPMLKALLTPGAHPQALEDLRIVGEIAQIPWQVRLHDRSNVEYAVHAVCARTGAVR
jgi:SAM-dependent methyltransferase/uncharacterized protein YbaR (Trm112 family)